MAVRIIWRVLEETLCSAPSRTSCFGWSTGHYGFTEKLIDVAYDVKDPIDLVMLKSARQGTRRGILEAFILFICDFIDQYQLHKKLEWIKVKIPALPPSVLIPHARSHFADIEEIANTGIPLVNSHRQRTTHGNHPEVKKKVGWLQDKFRLTKALLKETESVELDDRGMVWMQELFLTTFSFSFALGG